MRRAVALPAPRARPVRVRRCASWDPAPGGRHARLVTPTPAARLARLR
jgi:hypothetical protein